MDTHLGLGFLMILIAAVSGGAFGLQYTIMRRYTVENVSLVSLFFATVVVPLIAINFLLPGWTTAIAQAGWRTNMMVFLFGFGWGLGAITFGYAFNLLGMALAATIIKGLTIALGSGVPLLRNWDAVAPDARTWTFIGIATLLLGTTVSGRAGILREREKSGPAPAKTHSDASHRQHSARRRIFLLGFIACVCSGFLSAFINLGFEFGNPLEENMKALFPGELTWRATLIRWMPMYWGGITALMIFMGGRMIRMGTWRNYLAPQSGRDFMIASSMGIVHFLAQIPYGIGAYYLGALGTSVGWGANIGMALIVATSIGFMTGEWRGVSRRAVSHILTGICVVIFATGLLAYANSLQTAYTAMPKMDVATTTAEAK